MQRNIAAAILAGGKARRFNGITKGNLEIKPHFSIIQHLLNEIEQAGIAKKIIVANDPAPYLSYGVNIIADAEQGIGPLAGIAAALHYYQQNCEAILIMPCDTPLITANEIAVLRNAYLPDNTSIVYACTGEHCLHPLCAIVACSMVDKLDCIIAKGIRRVNAAWEEIGAKTIFFEQEKIFTNLNSSADLCKWHFTS